MLNRVWGAGQGLTLAVTFKLVWKHESEFAGRSQIEGAFQAAGAACAKGGNMWKNAHVGEMRLV